MEIIPVKKLKAEIAFCKDIGKLKEFKDKAEALRVFFRKAKIGFEIANQYSELKIRAERRCGEILEPEIKHGGDRKSESRFSYRTLKVFGLNKNQYRYWRAVAELPEDLFEEHLAKVKDAKKELTSACVYRRAFEFRRAKKADKAPIPDADSIKTPIRVRTITGDFRDYIDKFENVDAIITDPPYPKKYLHLYGDLAQFAAKVLKPGGSLFTMAGVHYLPQVLKLMTPHLNYQWTIAYHMPSRLRKEWNRKAWNFWKPILWFVNGKYEGKWVKDFILASPVEKALHPWQQSVAVFESLIEFSTKTGEMVIDPFFGTGTLGEAAIKLNRRFCGIEIVPKRLEIAEKRLERVAKKIVLPSYFPDENPAEILDNWEKQEKESGEAKEMKFNPPYRPEKQRAVQAEPFEENGKTFIPTGEPDRYIIKLKDQTPNQPKVADASDTGSDSQGLPN